MMKLLMMCLVAVTLPAMAQDGIAFETNAVNYDYPFLVFTDTDGNEQAFASEGLEMTFGNGVLLVKSGEKTTEVSLGKLSKMYFSETEPMATDIEKVSNVECKKLKDGIYDLTGRRVDHLAKGLYIVNGKKVLLK